MTAQRDEKLLHILEDMQSELSALRTRSTFVSAFPFNWIALTIQNDKSINSQIATSVISSPSFPTRLRKRKQVTIERSDCAVSPGEGETLTITLPSTACESNGMSPDFGSVSSVKAKALSLSVSEVDLSHGFSDSEGDWIMSKVIERKPDHRSRPHPFEQLSQRSAISTHKDTEENFQSFTNRVTRSQRRKDGAELYAAEFRPE